MSGCWVVEELKLMIDAFGLHARSNMSSEPDSFYTNFCLEQILSSNRRTASRNQRNLWTELSSCDHVGLFLTVCAFVY